MAEESRAWESGRGDLFTGLKFWLSHQVPMRGYYLDRLKESGATIVVSESSADIRIVDGARKNISAKGECYSYKFIEDSIKEIRLQDLENYVVNHTAAADRPVGSVTLASKGSRTPFTKEDDQILFNWVEPLRQNGGFWKGNQIYKQLAEKHPRHTYQSWRSRFLFMDAHGVKMTITQRVDPYAENSNVDENPAQERSPKRRRLEAPRSTDDLDVPKTPPEMAFTEPHRSRESPKRVIQESKQGTEVIQDNEAIQILGARIEESEVRTNNLVDPAHSSAPVVHQPSPTRSTADASVEVIGESVSRSSNLMLFDGTQDDPQERLDLDTDSPEHARLEPNTSLPEAGLYFVTASKSAEFSLEEVRQLYKAVPEILRTVPEDLDDAWEALAQERDQHTAAEWRLFYEETILPEYKRRHELKTSGDLEDHVSGLLASERKSKRSEFQVKEEPGSEAEAGSPAATGELKTTELDDAQEKVPREAPSGVLRSPPRQRQSNEAPTNDQQVTESVTVATVLQPANATQSRALPPEASQGSQMSPKKKLFGRTLSSEIYSLQPRSQDNSEDPVPSTERSFGNVSNASAIVSSTSQTIHSSKRPPESGQRPPKSTTVSQEDLPAQSADGRIPNTTAVSDDRITDTTGKLDFILERSQVSRGNSPALDLLGDQMQTTEDVRSSPAPSDTGSEYLAFDTAPERSQLWDVSQDDTIQETRLQISQRSARDSPEMSQISNIFRSRALPMPHRSPSAESNLVHDFSVGREGSPELDVQTISTNRAVPRTETQLLFQRAVPKVAEDTTIFDLPPPEGGWEELGDLEDEMEEVRTSVELADEDLPKDRVLSTSSQTNEDTFEHVRAAVTVSIPRQEGGFTSVGESDHTTFSEEDGRPESNTVAALPQLVQVHSVSSGSKGSSESHATSTPRTGHESDQREDSEASSVEEGVIGSWISHQSTLYGGLSQYIFSRLASTALQATVLNLSAATFTLRDLVAAFEESEAARRSRVDLDITLKRDHTDDNLEPKFRPKTRLTEEEARKFLPRDVFGVWTIDDDRDFLSQTSEGIMRVERKHGVAGVRKRVKFLRERYGEDGLDEIPTPTSALKSARRSR